MPADQSPTLKFLTADVARIIGEGVVRKHRIAIRNVEQRIADLERAARCGGYVPPGVTVFDLISLKKRLESSLRGLEADVAQKVAA